MQVVPFAEHTHHVLVFREVRHDAQFNLTVVGREEEATRVWDECLAYLLAILAANGNILQVRVGRGESAGGCNRLVERCVYVPGFLVYKFRKGIDIGAEKFFQPSVLQYVIHYLMFVAQCLQHFLTCNKLSCLSFLWLLNDFHLAKEYVAHLFRRCDVKLLARQFIYPVLQFLHSLGECLRCFGERLGVYPHAVHLHLCQHSYQGHLYFIEKRLHTSLFQFRLKHVFQLQGDVGIFASILINVLRRQRPHRPLVLSLRSDEFVYVNGFIIEVHLGHVVHVVTQFGLDEVVGYHRVPHVARESDTIVSQHLKVVLYVLSDFKNLRIFVQRFKNVNESLCLFLVFWDGYIKCLVRFHCETQTHQFCLNGVGRCGFCV